MTYRRFIASQSIIMMAGSMVFPFTFYCSGMLEIASRSLAGLWFICLNFSACIPLVGKLSDRVGDQNYNIYAWSMAILMLCFPIATEVWHVYILQILMGVLGAVQRNTEKTSLARKVVQENAGYEIGKYHVWTSIGGAVAIIATGYLVDFFTIGTIFI